MSVLERDVIERARELVDADADVESLEKIEIELGQDLDRLHYQERQLDHKKSMALFKFLQKLIVFIILFVFWKVSFADVYGFHGMKRFSLIFGGFIFLTLVVPMFLVTLKEFSVYIRCLDFEWAKQRAKEDKEFSYPLERERIYKRMSEIAKVQDEVRAKIRHEKWKEKVGG